MCQRVLANAVNRITLHHNYCVYDFLLSTYFDMFQTGWRESVLGIQEEGLNAMVSDFLITGQRHPRNWSTISTL